MVNKVIKSSAWYTISSFLLSSISIITTPIFSRILSLNEYGAYSNFIALYSVISVVTTFNFHSTLIRAKYDFPDKENEYISTLLYIVLFTIFIITIVSNVFFEFINKIFLLSRMELNLMMISLMFLPAINIFQTSQRIRYKYKLSVLISILNSIGNVLMSLLFVFILEDKLLGRLLGAQLPTILIGIGITIYYFRQSKIFNKEYCKYALKICIPFIPHLLSMNLLSVLDKLMITTICGAEYNALYSLAVNCGLIMTIIINALNSSFSPWLGAQLHLKNYSRIRKISYLYVLIFLVVAIGNLLLAPDILMIFGGTKYINAVYLVPPIVLGCMCQMLYTLYVNIEQFEKKTVGMALASTFAAMINFISNALLIPKFGYTAAAYTTFFSYFCLLLIHYFLVKKMKLAQVYNTKYLLFILFILIGIVSFTIKLYDFTTIRYIVFSVYLIGLFFILRKVYPFLKENLIDH